MSGTEYVNQYNDIHLTCNATGVDSAPEDIDWFFNGNKVEMSHPHWYGRIEIVKHKPQPGTSLICELIIHLSSTQDNGNYVCRSSELSFNSIAVHVLNGEYNNIDLIYNISYDRIHEPLFNVKSLHFVDMVFLKL